MIRRRISITISFIILTLLSLNSCEKEVSVNEPVEYNIGNAKYIISTIPEGAHIFVDGYASGQFTPDTIRWLSEGTHNFELRLHPFISYSFIDSVNNDSICSTQYDFYSDTKNFGSIILNSTPDSCTIFLNDVKLNHKTPYTAINLIPGYYKVKFTHPMHRADSVLHFVAAGKQSKVYSILQDTSIWVTYNDQNSDLSDNTINDIFIDNENNIWLATAHGGINKFNYKQSTVINTSNSMLPNDNVYCLTMDIKNTLWAGTNRGLASIDGNYISTYHESNSSLPSNSVTDIEFDKNGNLWIATRNGLAELNNNIWAIYNTTNSSIPGNYISKILFDKDDSLWIGTTSSNTAKFIDRYHWKSYKSDNSQYDDSVADLIVGFDDLLWIGLVTEFSKPGVIKKPGGVFTIENEQIVERDFSLPNKRINKFYLDKNNILWIGSRSGLLMVSSVSEYKLFNTNNSWLPIDDILSIDMDKYGNLWLGTNGAGLVKYKIGNVNK